MSILALFSWSPSGCISSAICVQSAVRIASAFPHRLKNSHRMGIATVPAPANSCVPGLWRIDSLVSAPTNSCVPGLWRIDSLVSAPANGCVPGLWRIDSLVSAPTNGCVPGLWRIDSLVPRLTDIFPGLCHYAPLIRLLTSGPGQMAPKPVGVFTFMRRMYVPLIDAPPCMFAWVLLQHCTLD